MTWTAFHNRGEILRTAISVADERRDGILPMDVAGVADTFRDDLDLLGAMALKWHTRLSGLLDRELAEQPLDLEHAVCVAWSTAAAEMPGTRLILDNYRAHPTDYAMAGAMLKSTTKERLMLSRLAGFASIGTAAADEAAERVGAAIEERARHLHDGAVILPERTERRSLIDRLRAAWVA